MSATAEERTIDPTADPTSDPALETGTVVAQLDDLGDGSMTLVKVDGRRICLVRTADGVHAIDNACPHEGYGLTQGGLNGDLVTCQWHNWKFRVTDGACVQGEEAVRVHDVDVDEAGTIRVTVNRPDPAALLPQLMTSLRSAIEKNYIGQVSRDVIRLLHGGADPGDLVWAAVEYGAPRAQDGWGHAIASAADCLAMVDLYAGDERALPIVQAIAGIAEVERGRPVNELPAPANDEACTLDAFRTAVESEQLAEAQAVLLGALARGDRAQQLVPWFTAVVADHHLAYGHGAIYVQKAFELLESLGWHRAPIVLGHLVARIVRSTREDLLPYIRPFTRAMSTVDVAALAKAPINSAWSGRDDLVAVLLGADRSNPALAVGEALRVGAGIDGVLDACVLAASERMLRYDVAGEFDFSDDFGWLDITHGLTYAHAARWHHRRAGASPVDAVRLTFWVAFLANWTGRHEWHTKIDVPADDFVLDVADLTAAGDGLQRRALLDGTSAFIVAAHAVKTSRAASRETLHLGDPRPLQAAARFIDAPKLERFVAASVTQSLDFLNGRTVRE